MVFRYYRSLLTEKEKTIYDLLLQGFESYSKEIVIPIENKLELSYIFNCVINDNPKIFYVKSFHTNIKIGILGVKNVITPIYLYSIDQITQLSHQCNKIISGIKDYCATMDDFSKEKLVHDLFCRKISYDVNNVNAHTILGALIDKRAVCDGISKAAKLLFDSLEICSCVVSGSGCQNGCETSNHQWNKVLINDAWSNLDITFDISCSKCGVIRYDYFNNSDLDFSLDHKTNGDSPICTSSADSYYEKMGFCVKSIDELEALLKASIVKKEVSTTFKFCNIDVKIVMEAIDSIIEKYCNQTQYTTYCSETKSIISICI